MNYKTLLKTFTIVSCLTLSNNNINKIINAENYQKLTLKTNANTLEKQNNEVTKTTSLTITIQDIADFLENKKEHYPLSDEFIEKYQQTSGGYISYALKTGHLVNKEMHEPNQKWHFFTSWLDQSIDDSSLSWEDDAKKRVYNGLLCPELLLWIFEACEVSPTKVRNAYKIAEEGKVNKTNVSTIAKNMRACVPWEDIQENILKQKIGE